MMTEFSHRSLHGAPHARRRLFIATLALVAIFGVDMLTGGFVRDYLRFAAASVWRATATARSGIAESGYFSTRGALAKENASLRSQLAQYQERAAGFAVLSEENTLLRGMLNLKSGERGITAPIVSSFRASPYGTFLIGAGERDVREGALVITEGGFVVGRVINVSERTALVNALFAADEKTDAHIGGSAVVVVGHGGGNARASVPRGITVSAGDSVTAPGLGGRPIGLVGSVESDASSADQTVYIQLPVNVSALRYVYIIHE